MPKVIQLPSHIANLIAAGEVVERPASAVKELLENAIDAGATQVTVEIRDGGMTFMRVTDNGCGMSAEDARTAFLRHATSKLRKAEDLAAIGTMGFRGEALAAIASVSRIDLLTKTPGALSGTSLHLEAGTITEENEAGCPEGTTIIIRDLFFNTPARMKFMKADSVEGSRVAATVQLQALAHPETAIKFLRDGKQLLSTPGTGSLKDTVYCVYGRDFAGMAEVNSSWDTNKITGFVCRPSDARPSRSLQTFFVNDRPVKSKLLVSALEEAYRNQLMVGKYPVCVLHLHIPLNAVDVNVHPAKTEVKFLNEKAVFDCVHYGVLAALNSTPDRPQVRFPERPQTQAASQPAPQKTGPAPQSGSAHAASAPGKDFFRTMTPEAFRAFQDTVKNAPSPSPAAAVRTIAALPDRNTVPSAAPANEHASPVLKEPVYIPRPTAPAVAPQDVQSLSIPAESPDAEPESLPEFVQEELPMAEESGWRMVGELFRTYIIVEQGEESYLIDKHAAHERILFDRLKANQEAISTQELLSPLPVQLDPAACAELLQNSSMLEELGFGLEEFGAQTVLLRRVPMDLSPEAASDTLIALAADLLSGKRETKQTVRDELLHTVACKAAIKAGWQNDDRELAALVKEVMSRDDLKHCPHGRPICITLGKKQIEKQFRRI